MSSATPIPGTPSDKNVTAANRQAGQWLIDDFRIGDFFFASPERQFRGSRKDVAAVSYQPATAETIHALFDQARQRGVAEPIMFGLVPFDVSRRASLAIPSQVESAPLPAERVQHTEQSGRPQIADQKPVPEPEQYGDMVRKALGLMSEDGLRKIVLSRTMEVTLDRHLEYARLLPDLLSRNAHGYTFAIPVWDADGQTQPVGMMVGASPELLVRRVGDTIHVNPLAGSIGRNPDPSRDQQLKDGLAVSEKDLREHSYVVNDIARILREHCVDLDIPERPSVIGTDTLWHLSTYITGRLRNPEMTALELACELHPTPAICGYPTATAFSHLPDLEPFDRGYFAGLVGWQQANGDGEWALSLRCAQQTGEDTLRLFAGAGIVTGSNPDHEILETATKMETFMRAIR